MIAGNTIQIVLVTPEKTLLEAEATALQFPLEDGQIGILPGRAPMVGRLGIGALFIKSPGKDHEFFIDGGFVQVKDGSVTLLTNRADEIPLLNRQEVEAAFEEALNRVTETPEEVTQKQIDVDRNRRLLGILKS